MGEKVLKSCLMKGKLYMNQPAKGDASTRIRIHRATIVRHGPLNQGVAADDNDNSLSNLEAATSRGSVVYEGGATSDVEVARCHADCPTLLS